MSNHRIDSFWQKRQVLMARILLAEDDSAIRKAVSTILVPDYSFLLVVEAEGGINRRFFFDKNPEPAYKCKIV